MLDKDATTPRVFLIRHGETEWSKSGQYTGSTDIPLTPHGEQQVIATGKMVYGPGRLIDPKKVAKVLVSPRSRAVRTFELLTGRQGEGYEVEERLREWEYGQYEGMKTNEIRELRKSHGLDQDRPWDIWRDGCEDGESPAELITRIDTLITQIRALQAPHMHDDAPEDVIVVAHGHLTRAFVKRWLGYEMGFPLSLMMEPGGVGVLSYQHHSVEEPALLLGIGFPL